MRSQSAVGLDIAVDQLRIRISRIRLVDVHEFGGRYGVGAGGGRDFGCGQCALSCPSKQPTFTSSSFHDMPYDLRSRIFWNYL